MLVVQSPTEMNATFLSDQQYSALHRLLHALIDQAAARVLVAPQADADGFWFGGGNMVQAEDGSLWLCGRYRNHGDSRTGLEVGTRGLECALFRSIDGGASFQKARHWSKADLGTAQYEVISIEGTSLQRLADGSWELYISTEKSRAYPAAAAGFQKPGTGVWSIERLHARRLDGLDVASLTPVLETDRPEYLHMKDPVTYALPGGETALIFCTHPFTWAASNSGLAVRGADQAEFTLRNWEVVARGPAWGCGRHAHH
ncbi:MAG: hypothetical protein HC915_01580 [Anaerolineae bacterium]|nr:hypothetical protein [Anaerolineae bacterium]